MPPKFIEYKQLVDDFLRAYLTENKDSLSMVNPFGGDLIDRILPMVTAGKTIRGSLVLLSYCFTNEKPTRDAIKAAAALELLQTALVIHDDIMDKDSMRRGIPSLHIQYKSDALAMCAGDVLFFMAFELLGSLDVDAATLSRIIRYVGKEYQSVGVAQMADVSKRTKTKEDVIRLYTYKTARYTFAVPLVIGATLAGNTDDMIKYLSIFGENVGVLFQIRDDILDSEENPFTGKDIDAYKQTIAQSVTRLTIDEKHKNVLRALADFVMKRKK
jgi:geranylgeranyl diphosphate synthase, type I